MGNRKLIEKGRESDGNGQQIPKTAKIENGTEFRRLKLAKKRLNKQMKTDK